MLSYIYPSAKTSDIEVKTFCTSRVRDKLFKVGYSNNLFVDGICIHIVGNYNVQLFADILERLNNIAIKGFGNLLMYVTHKWSNYR